MVPRTLTSCRASIPTAPEVAHGSSRGGRSLSVCSVRTTSSKAFRLRRSTRWTDFTPLGVRPSTVCHVDADRPRASSRRRRASSRPWPPAIPVIRHLLHRTGPSLPAAPSVGPLGDSRRAHVDLGHSPDHPAGRRVRRPRSGGCERCNLPRIAVDPVLYRGQPPAGIVFGCPFSFDPSIEPARPRALPREAQKRTAKASQLG